MIKIKNVNFQYSDKKVLQDISFTIPKASFFGIVGPNGSGKTTLLNLITRNIQSFSGTITVDNKNINEYDILDLARTITLVPQNMAIKFPYTCLEIVMMGRTPYKNRFKSLHKEDMNIVYQVMEETNTLAFAGRLITELSGGEQQRVFLAKALVQQPKILFLDEAFANMDIYYSLMCLNLLKKRVTEGNLTIVSIMHDLNLVSTYCSHTALLQQGILVKSGLSDEVMQPELLYNVFGIKVVKAGARGLAVLSEL